MGLFTRRSTFRAEKIIEFVGLFVEYNARCISCSGNGFALSPSTFNKIMKQDLKRYPYRVVTLHELCNLDYVRCFQFCQCFLNQYRTMRFSVNIIVGEEEGFLLNDEVSSRNACQYAPVGDPPNFVQRSVQVPVKHLKWKYFWVLRVEKRQ